MRSTHIDILLEFTLIEQPIEVIGTIGENKSVTASDAMASNREHLLFLSLHIFETHSLSNCSKKNHRQTNIII